MDPTLRQPTDADWPAILALVAAAAPESGAENARWLEQRRRFDESGYPRRHHVAEDPSTGLLLAYAGVEAAPEPGLFRVVLVLPPPLLRDGLGAALYERLRADMAELGATHAYLCERERDNDLLDFFAVRGFATTRRETLPDGEPCVVLESALTE
ncbi:MAG TPA: hypothetical protein VFU88_20305 [Ktedonobacterales bacterium]|nr:hypothetical protein [Ktedonobacterales bacterium]